MQSIWDSVFSRVFMMPFYKAIIIPLLIQIVFANVQCGKKAKIPFLEKNLITPHTSWVKRSMLKFAWEKNLLELSRDNWSKIFKKKNNNLYNIISLLSTVYVCFVLSKECRFLSLLNLKRDRYFSQELANKTMKLLNMKLTGYTCCSVSSKCIGR